MKEKIVLYFSKNNTTAETVEKIKNKVDENTQIVDLAKSKKIDFRDVKTVYIGTGIYMGSIPGKVKKYIKANAESLNGKEIVFFVHGIISKDIYKDIVNKVVDGILEKSKIKIYYLGGKLDITKQNFIIRKLLIEVAKQNNFDPYNANTIDNEKINELLKNFD